MGMNVEVYWLLKVARGGLKPRPFIIGKYVVDVAVKPVTGDRSGRVVEPVPPGWEAWE